MHREGQNRLRGDHTELDLVVDWAQYLALNHSSMADMKNCDLKRLLSF
jgi:hypothetical protein